MINLGLRVNKRISQAVMIWFLPIIIIGGVVFPVLGYLVFLMMIFFFALAYFKGRFWCGHLCPRGAFLDIALKRLSRGKRIPRLLADKKFRWSVFAVVIAFFIFQFIVSPKDLFSIGTVFVRMCLITTLIAIVIGIPIHERAWCIVCPMGMLQEKIGSLRRHKQAE